MEQGQNELLTLVVLAAGDSKRFGANKLLHRLNGKPMYQYILEQIEKMPPELIVQKILVTQYPEIKKEAERRGFQVIENRESYLGISHSLQLGLLAAAGENRNSEASQDGGQVRRQAVLFAVCDQPGLRAGTMVRLIQEWRESGKGIACLGNGGEPGNPVIFTETYFPELLELEGDTGGRKVLRRHMNDVWICQAAEQELADIDTRDS